MRLSLVMFLVVVFGVAALAAADVPKTLSYQGVLKDSEGNTVPDDLYTITFRIYDADSGGSSLWAETDTLEVTGGVFNAILGKTSEINLAFDTTYYLSLQIGAGSELAPRIELTAAPYARRAAIADSALSTGGGVDADWQYSGSNIYHLTGQVGVGTSVYEAQLTIYSGDNHGIKSTVTSANKSAVLGISQSGNGVEGWATSPAVVSYGVAGYSQSYCGVYGRVWNATGTNYGVYGYTPSTSGYGMFGQAGGTSGTNYGVYGTSGSTSGYGVYGYNPTGYGGWFVGTTGVTGDLSVSGTATVGGFRLTASPAASYVLTSDALGNGTWKPAGTATLTLPYAGSVDSDMYTAFSITNDGEGRAGEFFVSSNTNSNAALYGGNYGTGSGVEGYNNSGYWGALGSYGAGARGQTEYGFGVWGMSTYGTAVLGQTTTGHGVRGESQDSMGVWGSGGYQGVHGVSQNGTGVIGLNAGSGNYGELGTYQYGAYAKSGTSNNYCFMGSASSGVRGVTDNYFGAEGWATGTGTGVKGFSQSGVGVKAEGYVRGLQAQSTDSTGAWASGGTFGVDGTSFWGSGVRGTNERTGNYGLVGALDYAVYGFYPNISGGNYGALGTNGMGVYAYGYQGCYAIGTTDGVHGYGQGASAKGTYGEHGTSGNYGYLGDTNYGVYGKHNASGNDGYIGSSSYGVYGQSAGGYAGYFSGKAKVTGDLEVGNMARVYGTTWPTSGEGLELGYDPSLNRAYVQSYDRGTGAFGDTYMGAGRVGFGITTPARPVHIKDVMRLEPRTDYPSSPSDGDLCVVGAAGSRHIYCYLNGLWKQLD